MEVWPYSPSLDVIGNKFETTATSNFEHYVALSFLHAHGDVDVTLHDSCGSQIGGSYGVGNSERISLVGQAAGRYFVNV